VYTMSTHFAAE